MPTLSPPFSVDDWQSHADHAPYDTGQLGVPQEPLDEQLTSRVRSLGHGAQTDGVHVAGRVTVRIWADTPHAE